MPLTHFRLPGTHTGLPAASFTTCPFSSFFSRPFSRMSKAMALARRVEVVFRLTL